MKRTITVLVALFIAIGAMAADCVTYKPTDHVKFPSGWFASSSACRTVAKAAERNHINNADDYAILLAIWKAESGGADNGKAFGVKHPKAWDTTLDKQAGWAAATVRKHRKRCTSTSQQTFINSLGDRYCPRADDPEGNRNWKRNVWHWYRKLKPHVQ